MEKSNKVQMVELLAEIRDELKATRLANALKGAPKLWSKVDIGIYFDLATRTIDEVVQRHGFPAPVSTTGSSKGHRWFMEDVVEWARLNASRIAKGRKR